VQAGEFSSIRKVIDTLPDPKREDYSNSDNEENKDGEGSSTSDRHQSEPSVDQEDEEEGDE